jgi:hypothetical protein
MFSLLTSVWQHCPSAVDMKQNTMRGVLLECLDVDFSVYIRKHSQQLTLSNVEWDQYDDDDDRGRKFSRDILGYCFRFRTMVTGKENLKSPTGKIQIIRKETKQLQV